MKLIAAFAILITLSACSLPVFFRVPIVQGNIVTAEQVSKLEKGMTKKQVAYVLGTPLIESPFEADRWDYVFYYRNPRAHVRQSQLNLFFTDDTLSDIEGNEEYAAQALSSDKQSGTDSDRAPLPGETSSVGAPLGVTNDAPVRSNSAADSNTRLPRNEPGRPSTTRPDQTLPGTNNPTRDTLPPNTPPVN